ncbi:outer membrane beta-barrel protein [Alteromonas gracilis]|uniref:outer membrane beta-barrel protein n=1 Tax=Alteromonas gracilis TaxID=1479524 RepID=UPI003735C99B
MRSTLAVCFALLLVFGASLVHADTHILVRASAVNKDNSQSFQQMGQSHQRFDGNGVHLAQAILATDVMLNNNWSAIGVVNGYTDGEQKVGVSELYLKYRPFIASTIKPEVKVGAFFPALSAENTDIGWLSPHFLSNSAINSWVGEELRTGGIEVSIRQNGRQVRSNWSWKILGSVFKGNDTTGTLLSWRGFALHDRQSVYNDRVNFLPIPGVVSEEGLNAPAWTDPFREIDGRFGYYAGAHLAYKRRAELRYYFYDNNADPNILDSDRIYAWHTQFHSLTLRYMPRPDLTLFTQILVGDTLMGEHVVDNDFASAYIAAAYNLSSLNWDHITVAMRADWYQVTDNDNTINDPNGSRGSALTVSARYDLNRQLAVTAEWQVNTGHQENLQFFQDGDDYTEQQLQLALTVTF